MRKTTLYLRDIDLDSLHRLTRQEGRSQSEVVRLAIAAYDRARQPNREFALTGSGRGAGRSVADLSEEELLKGFGD